MPSWCDLVTWFNLKDALFSGCFRFQVDQFRRWSKLLLPGTEWVISLESILQESSHHFHVCVNTCRSFRIFLVTYQRKEAVQLSGKHWCTKLQRLGSETSLWKVNTILKCLQSNHETYCHIWYMYIEYISRDWLMHFQLIDYGWLNSARLHVFIVGHLFCFFLFASWILVYARFALGHSILPDIGYQPSPIHKDPFPLRLRAQSLVVRAERAALDYGELLQGRVTLTEVGALENDIDAVSHRWETLWTGIYRRDSTVITRNCHLEQDFFNRHHTSKETSL